MRRVKAIPGNLPLFAPESSWKCPNLADLPDWSNATETALDTEFKDPTLVELGCGARRGARIAGYSFMLRGHRPFYVPIRHPGSNNCDEKQSLSYLRDNLRKFKGKLLGANVTGDLDILEVTENIAPDYSQCQIQDIQIRGPLINENRFKYSLEAEAEVWGLKGKSKDKLKEAAQSYGWDVSTSRWMACIPDLPSEYVGVYGEHDVEILFPIFDAQQKVIDAQGLNQVVNLEADLLPILLKMRQRGIRIDFDELDRVEKWTVEEENKFLAEIKRLTKVDIGFNNIMSVSRVAPALREIGIKLPVTDKGQDSITAELLAAIDHDVARHILWVRKVNKIRTTFVASVRRYAVGDRIHTTFKQVVGASSKSNERSGAAHGRLSCCDPNLQQQPKRGKVAKRWRKIYLPDEGKSWFSADLSAQEPRWAVFLAEKLKLAGAKEMADRYRNDPRIDPHQATADITGLSRDNAKTVLLARLYGEGDPKLCKTQLKMPTRWMVRTDNYEKFYFDTGREALEFRASLQGKCKIKEVAGKEAQEVIDKFNAGAPFYGELARKAIEKADATGVIKLVGGRHLHFEMDPKDGTFKHTYKALNRAIQGNSAYQVKMALIAVEKEFPGVIQLQIHDELLGSVTSKKMAKDIAHVMENVVRLTIPFRSEVDYGSNWSDMPTVCNVKDCYDNVNPADKYGCDKHSLKKTG